MPQVGGINVSDCICQFAEALGPAKQTLIAFIDSAIALLQAAKIVEQLASFSIEDYGRKALLEISLVYYQTLVADVAAGVNVAVGFTTRFSDCAPVSSFSRKVKALRDDFLGPLYEKEYEIQQYIEAINDKARKVQQLQKTIDFLTTWKDAIDACGT